MDKLKHQVEELGFNMLPGVKQEDFMAFAAQVAHLVRDDVEPHVDWLRNILPDYLTTLSDNDEDQIYADSRSLAKEQIEGMIAWLDPKVVTPEDEIAALKQRVAQLEKDNADKQRTIDANQKEIDSWKL